MAERVDDLQQQDAVDSAANHAPDALRFGQIQRRQLTILFVDLAGSTTITQRFDVEEVRELLLSFLDSSAARIEAASGYIARFMGDGILAYFGYPVAHAESAALAVHAGLDVQNVVSRLKLPDGTRPTARIGIATGEVMIGDIVGRSATNECMVIGDAANLAARLQSAARPGQTLICGTTQELVGNAFSMRAINGLELKGFAKSVTAWEVRESLTHDRFARHVGKGLAPLVGRDQEFDLLTARLHRLDAGSQQLLVTGEPGIGKSRLLHALRQQAHAEGIRWLATSGAATATQTPYFGLRQLLERQLKGTGKTPARIAARLFAVSRRLGMAKADSQAMATISGLLPSPGQPGNASCSSTQLPHLCAAFLTALTHRTKVVVAIEDAHWLDESSSQLLREIVPLVSHLPIMLVLTARLETAPRFPDWPVMVLPPLDGTALAEIARHATGHAVDDATLAGILDRAQGIALFAEELARLLARQTPGAAAKIPASLADLLLSQIDRGKDGLAVAQAIALLGEDARPATIAGLVGRDPATVDRTLDVLRTERVLAAASEGRPATFRHALFGESAYGAMPGRLRATMHQAAARLLIEEHVPASRIARHFDLGKDARRAAEWWQSAAHLARRQRALPEARSAYERALALTASLPAETPDLQAAQLTLQSHYFEILQLSLGYSATETIAAGQRLRQLVEQQGDLQQQLTAITGEWAAASSAGEYDLANRHAARAPIIARTLNTPDAIAAAAMIQLTARYRCGDLIGAEDAFAEGAPHFFDPQFYRRTGAIAQTFGNAAINAWLLGNDGAARDRIAILAESEARLDDSYSRAFSQHMASMALLVLGELTGAEAAARCALEIAERAGFAQYEAIARISLGRALCGQGDQANGLALMREGLQRMEITRSRAAITLYHVWLGQAEIAAGQPIQALGTVERGMHVCPQERYVVPELLRLRAMLEAENGRAQFARQLLQDARAKAEAMQAQGLLRLILATDLAPASPKEPSRLGA